MLRDAVARQVDQHLPQLAEINGNDGEDGAELDQDLEGLAGGFEAEEMAGQQKVSCRGDGDELGQPLQYAEEQGLQDRLVFHGAIRSEGRRRHPFACNDGQLTL
jgi:hypothetical protein